MPCKGCPPYVGSSIIDDFERTVSAAWGTPSRGTPDWVDYGHSEQDSSFSQIGVSAIGPSTGWGRIILTLTKPPTSFQQGASHEMQLAVPELDDWDEFVLQFDMAVAPSASNDGIAYAQIRLGGSSDGASHAPGIDLPFQFEHVANPIFDHLDFFLARDNLGGDENTRSDTIANTHSFDGRITIDRSVTRGSTLVAVGAFGVFAFSPISPEASSAGTPEKKLYVGYIDGSRDALSSVSSTCSIDNIVLVRGSASPPRPLRYQRVQDEYVALGDGLTTSYATRWPYVLGTLQVQTSGMLAEVDNADPATGDFELVDPAPLASRIVVTYVASGA